MWRRHEIRSPQGATSLIGFAGDTLLGFPDGRKTQVDPALLELLSQCDHVVVNQEGAITDSSARSASTFPFRVPTSCAEQLLGVNATVASLANNHVMDCGRAGMDQTVQALRDVGIATVGAGPKREGPLLLDLHEGKLALLAFFHCAPSTHSEAPGGPDWLDLPAVKSQVATLRAEGHVVCVIYHGGAEFFGIPSPSRRAMLRELSQAGASIVIAHHAHVFQGMEVVDGRLIAYGLGNLYFDSPRHHWLAGTDVGLVVGVEIDAKGPCAVRHVFAHADRTECTLGLLSGKALRSAEKLFAEMSSLLRAEHNYARAWRHECVEHLLARHLTGCPQGRGRARWAVLRAKVSFAYLRGALRSEIGREIVRSGAVGFPRCVLGPRLRTGPFLLGR